MRDHANLSPKFWTGATGRKMRGKPHVQVLALYLMSCPQSNMIGLFYLPRPMLAYETGLSDADVADALAWLETEDVAYYDADDEIAWIPNMVAYQVGEVKAGDKRIAGVRNAFKTAPRHRFTDDFFERYGERYGLDRRQMPRTTEAPYKPLTSPLQAPCKQGDDPLEAFTGAGTGTGTRAGAARDPAPLDLNEIVEAINRPRRVRKLTAINAMTLHGEAAAAFFALVDIFPVDTLASIEREHESWLATASQREIADGCPWRWWLKEPNAGSARAAKFLPAPKREHVSRFTE